MKSCHAGISNITAVVLLICRVFCHGSYDVDEKELQYLAHHLNLTECRVLVESMHINTKFLTVDQRPTGDGVPQNMSCIELLNNWDQKESRHESFVKMASRLRELGHEDLAKKFSQAVFKDKEAILDAMVLDPLTTGSSKLETEEVSSINSPDAGSGNAKMNHITDFDGRDSNSAAYVLPDWTLSQKVLFVISTVFMVGLFGFWLFHCVPDCVGSLCRLCRRDPRRNRDDAAHFLLNELDDNDDG